MARSVVAGPFEGRAGPLQSQLARRYDDDENDRAIAADLASRDENRAWLTRGEGRGAMERHD